MMRVVSTLLMLMALPIAAASSEYEQADAFLKLRGQALVLNGEMLEPRNGVFALLMETGYGDAVVTVLAAADGSSSLYFSNSGELIGAGEYAQIRAVAFEALSAAASSLKALSPTDTYPIPDSGRTRCYAVTKQGVLTAEAFEDVLGSNKHELSPLFQKVHRLISYIRAIDEHRRHQESE